MSMEASCSKTPLVASGSRYDIFTTVRFDGPVTCEQVAAVFGARPTPTMHGPLLHKGVTYVRPCAWIIKAPWIPANEIGCAAFRHEQEIYNFVQLMEDCCKVRLSEIMNPYGWVYRVKLPWAVDLDSVIIRQRLQQFGFQPSEKDVLQLLPRPAETLRIETHLKDRCVDFRRWHQRAWTHFENAVELDAMAQRFVEVLVYNLLLPQVESIDAKSIWTVLGLEYSPPPKRRKTERPIPVYPVQ